MAIFVLLQRNSLSELPVELTFPKKSPFQVFVAKYSYDPQEFSPNENPDSELILNAGDYIFVYGDMDEVSHSVILMQTKLTSQAWFLNSLAPGRCGCNASNLKSLISEH